MRHHNFLNFFRLRYCLFDNCAWHLYLWGLLFNRGYFGSNVMNCTWNGLISCLPLCMYIYTCKTPMCNRNLYCIVYILHIFRYTCRYIIPQCSWCFYLFNQSQRPAIYSGAGFHSQPCNLPPWLPWSLCWSQIFPLLSHHCSLDPIPASLGGTGGFLRAEE